MPLHFESLTCCSTCMCHTIINMILNFFGSGFPQWCLFQASIRQDETMFAIRSWMVLYIADMFGRCVTIATRYSVVRRQTQNRSGKLKT